MSELNIKVWIALVFAALSIVAGWMAVGLYPQIKPFDYVITIVVYLLLSSFSSKLQLSKRVLSRFRKTSKF